LQKNYYIKDKTDLVMTVSQRTFQQNISNTYIH